MTAVINIITLILFILLFAGLARVIIFFVYHRVKAQAKTKLTEYDVIEAAEITGIGISKATAREILRESVGQPEAETLTKSTNVLTLNLSTHQNAKDINEDLPLPLDSNELTDMDATQWNVHQVFYKDTFLSSAEDAPLPN